MAESVQYETENPIVRIDQRTRQGKHGQSKTWLGWIWDTADNTPEERRLLFKVDAAILSIFCTLCSVRLSREVLDQGNINNAYLSGMKEDLGMKGNDLVHVVTVYNVGYILGQLPLTLLLTRLPVHWVIPAIEIGVGIGTLGAYAVKNLHQLYAVRFIAGFFEGGYFPGVMYVLSTWYTPAELGKRSGLFYASGMAGGLFSGFLQTAAWKNLSGVRGLNGWRWLFIIDAIITFGTALIGFFFLPDLPYLAKPSVILTQADIDLAKVRLERIERAPPVKWSKAKVIRIVTDWRFWLFPIQYALYNSGSPQQAMGYWLKSFNAKPAPVPGKSYTIGQINLLPLPYVAIATVATFSFNWISDGPLRGRRWPMIFLQAVGTLSVAIGLRVIPVYGHDKAHYALYYLVGIGSGIAMGVYSWAAEETQHDNELRAVVLAAMNMAAFTGNAILPNFVWKTSKFPAARTGYTFSIGMYSSLILITGLLLFLTSRYSKFNKKSDAVVASSSHTESIDEKKENFV